MKNLIKIAAIALLVTFTLPQALFAQDGDQNDREENEESEEPKRNRKSTRNFFNVEFGLSNYLMASGKFPDATDEIYTLNPLGSVSFGLSAMNETRVAGPLFLEWGANVTWYALKFQDPKTRLAKDTDGAVFSFDNNNFASYKKSKLKITYINAMFIPMIHTDPKSKNGGFRFGAGVFGGYRVGSNLKVVFDNGKKQKDKIRSNFFLNNVRYGVRAQVGWKGTDLFFTYDMNTLFQENQGPELNPIGFGIIF